MTILLALIPIMPLLGFLILACCGSRMSKQMIAFTGAVSVGISVLITLITGLAFLVTPPAGNVVVVNLWQWFSTGGLALSIVFRLDALSLVFIFVITFIGFLIHVYSIDFMAGDEGYARFFAYMNLFVGSMLILVLADNLLLLYLGWEGVGLCSYLLIGFWYREPVNGYAARKAFIITRIGDTAMIIGIFLLFVHFHTLDIQLLMQQASSEWGNGSPLATWAALLLLGGALGKSAQLPLQTWLPDAMAGPSPVSALIHAATMVTAGVYLIARTHVLFELAPAIQTAVAAIGALTLLLAGFSALAQHDLKRVLAYSTISQIGYMFLALGVGAWSAGIFHFMVHAFFKALLFLAGGAVIFALNEEHDIFKMGGLRKKLPVIFWTFLIGSSSLAALPLITAGFYSKDQILWFAWSAGNGNPWLWAAGLLGAFITSMYTFRLVFLVFFGDMVTMPEHHPGRLMLIPMIILAFFSLIAGFIELPESMGHVQWFSKLLDPVLPAVNTAHGRIPESFFQLVAGTISLSGIYLAYRFYLKQPYLTSSFNESRISKFLYKGWGFDRVYDLLFVNPLVWFAVRNKNDFIDLFTSALARAAFYGNYLLSITQNGRIRWYVMAFVIGIVFMLTIFINL
ncbi:MAG TPA: NADH-quinone oxidoreductase subunit L [Bacteroidales bacterium]|nr:NADH-quinone oxidoreductase subunit L [Bacteroidales bacterium]